MSISFNTKDYNLSRIKQDSKLFNLNVLNTYRIYGLKQEDNPPILITEHGLEPTNKVKFLKKFFKLNNIDILIELEEEEDEYDEYDEYDDDSSVPYVFSIGLRKDLRDHITLCSAIIQTIIYTYEDRLRIKAKKIPGIPKFSNKTPKSKSKVDKYAVTLIPGDSY